MNTQIILPPAYQKPTGRLYLQGDQDNIASGVSTKVEINYVSAEYVDGIEDGVNHRITPGVPGFYTIQGQIVFEEVVADKQYIANIYVNGSPDFSKSYAHSSNVGDISASVNIASVWLSATDYMELYGEHNAGVGTVDFAGGRHNTFLIVQRVR